MPNSGRCWSAGPASRVSAKSMKSRQLRIRGTMADSSSIQALERNEQDTGKRGDVRMNDLKKLIREVPDYPKPGILFYDLTTLLKDKQGFHTLIDRLCEHYNGHAIDIVAGIVAPRVVFAP